MEIIKKGSLDKITYNLHFICPNCGCEFVCNSDEYEVNLNNTQSENILGFYRECPTIDCKGVPKCYIDKETGLHTKNKGEKAYKLFDISDDDFLKHKEVRNKKTKKIHQITNVYHAHNGRTYHLYIYVNHRGNLPKDLFLNYEFLDGTPCGTQIYKFKIGDKCKYNHRYKKDFEKHYDSEIHTIVDVCNSKDCNNSKIILATLENDDTLNIEFLKKV